MVLLGIFGAVVELTKIGDIPNLDYRRVNKLKAKDVYEPLTMQRKKPWAQLVLSLSVIRNAILSFSPPQLMRQYDA